MELRFRCLDGLCGASQWADTWCEALSSVSLVSGGPPGTNLRNPAYLWFWGSFEFENCVFIWISGHKLNTCWYHSNPPQECRQMFKWTTKINSELKNWFLWDLCSRGRPRLRHIAQIPMSSWTPCSPIRAITWCEALSSVSLVCGGPPGTNLRNPAYLWFRGKVKEFNDKYAWI